MFWHNFKYSFLTTIRNKANIVWTLIFPIALGTLFYAAFGNLYEKDEAFHDVKVAVYLEDDSIEEAFSDHLANAQTEDGKKLLNITYTESIEEADKLLEDEKVSGYLYTEGSDLKLCVKENGLDESMLSSVTCQYHQIITVIEDVAKLNPDMIETAMTGLMDQTVSNTQINDHEGGADMYSQYFFNLLAMTCLFAIFSAITFTVNNQANLSAIGARKTAARTSGVASSVSGLIVQIIVNFTCTCFGYVYLTLLGVDFGSQIGFHILTIFAGSCVGVSLGFFLGSIGRMSENAKQGIGTSVSLALCFLSGLMVANMRIWIQSRFPLFNKINPAACITDAFYSLDAYEGLNRYWGNIINLFVISIILIVLGVIMGRRKRYASI